MDRAAEMQETQVLPQSTPVETKPPNSALTICGRSQWAPELVVCVEQDS